MPINKNIFRTYDIRGVYPDELNDEAAELIGKGLGSIFISKKLKNVAVGREIRPSSDSLSKYLIKGLLSTGCNVLDIGVVTTPMVHFVCCTQKVDAGIMITASHNPAEFNGFKIDYKNAMPFSDDDILGLHAFIERGVFIKGKGTCKKKDIYKDYAKYFKDNFSFKHKLKVYIDCAGGGVSPIAPVVFKAKNVEFTLENIKPDPTFKNGVPNPENQNLMKSVSEKVLEGKYDIGITFDNDGDRMGVVDEKGVIYTPDRILMLYAKYILKAHPNSRVLADIKSSGICETVVKEFGGNFEFFQTGRSWFLKEVVPKKAILGCEFSGHCFFSDKHFGYDDAFYSCFRLLEILDMAKKPLSELMSEFPTSVTTHELKVKCSDDEKFQTMEEIKSLVTSSKDYNKVLTIDGVRAYISDTGWFLIRISNTTPYLIVRMEGATEKEIEELTNHVNKTLDHFGLTLN